MPLPSLESLPGGRAVGGLSRRVRTLIVAAVLFVVLFVLALVMPVPYVVLSPGPTYNTLGKDNGGTSIITIDGRTANRTTGHLNLTTVSVTTQSITPFQAVVGWLAHDQVVVPRSAVYPPGQTQQQTDAQNKDDFVTSQDSAAAAALCQLGYPKGFGIVQVQANGPSDGVLRTGDELVTVDGRSATSAAALAKVLTSLDPGAKVPVVVKRDGRTITEQVTAGQPPKNATGARLGIAVTTTCLAPFEVDLGLANQIGGPSAGLMFALGIIDKVGKTDVTDGRFIAGTGTIVPSGKVGPIGGIALKMIAARDKGASIFLAPAGNCSDVRGAIPSGLDVVKVSSLQDALRDLDRLHDHESVPHC